MTTVRQAACLTHRKYNQIDVGGVMAVAAPQSSSKQRKPLCMSMRLSRCPGRLLGVQGSEQQTGCFALHQMPCLLCACRSQPRIALM